MDDTDLGTLTREGDRWMLTFTRKLAHPREKVWRAVTEPAHLTHLGPDAATIGPPEGWDDTVG